MVNGQQYESLDQDRQPSTRPNSSELTLVPFVPVNDGWILSDDFLAGVFEQTRKERLHRFVFWQGTIDSPERFIAMLKKNVAVLIFDGHNCIGYAWLNGLSENYAFGHFCFFKCAFGDVAARAGRQVLDYWFRFESDDGPLLDTIIGLIPGFNKLAHKYVERLGFQRLGDIPGMLKNKSGDRENAVIFFKRR